MGKLTVSMSIFNSFLYVYQRVHTVDLLYLGKLEYFTNLN